MSAVILDGKALAAKITGFVAEKSSDLARPPGLAVLLVGEDPASMVYVGRKQKMAQKCGFQSRLVQFDKDVAEEEVVLALAALSEEEEIDGILLQLPLPSHLSRQRLLAMIDPEKDSDGLTPEQAGLLAQGRENAIIPCTARGCFLLLRHYGVALEGSRALVVGRSELVGRPLGLLLLNHNCTLTFAHSKSRDLPQLAAEADILALAAGQPHLVGADWVKPDAAVLDIGIHRSEQGLIGDVRFDEVLPKAGFLTPVPGGVGPMTVACLLLNTLELAFRRQNKPVPTLPQQF